MEDKAREELQEESRAGNDEAREALQEESRAGNAVGTGESKIKWVVCFARETKQKKNKQTIWYSFRMFQNKTQQLPL